MPGYYRARLRGRAPPRPKKRTRRLRAELRYYYNRCQLQARLPQPNATLPHLCRGPWRDKHYVACGPTGRGCHDLNMGLRSLLEWQLHAHHRSERSSFHCSIKLGVNFLHNSTEVDDRASHWITGCAFSSSGDAEPRNTPGNIAKDVSSCRGGTAQMTSNVQFYWHCQPGIEPNVLLFGANNAHSPVLGQHAKIGDQVCVCSHLSASVAVSHSGFCHALRVLGPR